MAFKILLNLLVLVCVKEKKILLFIDIFFFNSFFIYYIFFCFQLIKTKKINCSFFVKRIYNYNGNNDVVSMSFENTETKYEEIYKYEYDKYGNWIKKEKFEDNILQLITVRELEYFD